MHKSKYAPAAAGTLIALTGMLVTPVFAQESVNSSGWYKVCADQGENKICNVQYQAFAASGQVITSVNLAEITGKIKNKVFQVTVPTSRLVPPGLRMKVDDHEVEKIAYSFCTPRICAAERPLDNALVERLKSGSRLELLSVNWQGKENPIGVSLEGFSGAYDGDPLTREEFAARQKKLTEVIQNKSLDVLKKLQDAQEKAREGETTQGGD